MKLYFDVSTFNPDKVTGIGVYMMLLMKWMLLKNKEIDFIPSIKLNRYPKRSRVEASLHCKCHILPPIKIFHESHTLYHGPDFKMNIIGNIPKIVTIHDMVVFEKSYNSVPFYEKGIRDLTKILNTKSLSGVITISEFTKSQILKYFPHLSDKIFVTHLGCDRFEIQKNTNSLSLPEDYILFLGTIEKRKNILGIIKAFEIFRKNGGKEKLILAGAYGYGANEIQSVFENSSAKEHILFLNYVKNEQVSELYQRAKIFFFPSLYEGFGIPVLEAMRHNCPVVTSQDGALKEVCGNAAIFVDPQNCEQMANALLKTVSNDMLLEKLKIDGKKRCEMFTWETCAQKTIEIYKHVLNKMNSK